MIVVTGATGTIGRALIEELGGAARAVVRRAEQGEELGCDYVVGDLERPASIPLEPGDRLFLNSALWPGFVRAHKAVIDHARAAEAAAHLEKRGMPAQAARDLAELMSQIGDGRWASTTTTVADILGREPRSLREFLG